MKTMPKLLIAVVASASIALLAGCNTVKGTVQGAGQDLTAVSTAVKPQPHHRHHTVSRTPTHAASTIKPRLSNSAAPAAAAPAPATTSGQ